MKDRKLIIKLLKLLSLIILYYISGKTSMFIYLLTMVLYNIYTSSFKHIKINEKFKKTDTIYTKIKLIKYTSLCVVIISLIFTLLSLLISESISIFLNVNKTVLPFLIMSISVITEPFTNLITEYFESIHKSKISSRLYYTYYIIEFILFIIIAIITLRIFKLPIHIVSALLYIPKIISLISVIAIIYLIFKNKKTDKIDDEQIEYQKEVKNILKNNIQYSFINVCKYGYYYISIIVLYLVLSTRYSYQINTIEEIVTLIYLYGINVINILSDIILNYIDYKHKNNNIISKLLEIFRYMLTITIIIVITSPLICKIIFNNNNYSIYFAMLGILSIFLSLFTQTFKNIRSKKIIYISLLIGIFSKIILLVPLINTFYRMGYNLIYGDILSTIISMSISIIINYIYLQNKNKKERFLEKILTTIYENMILCIILIVLQFIIPIKTNNYILAILIFILYMIVSIIFLKYKKKKRG